jgi:hypothetical protein
MIELVKNEEIEKIKQMAEYLTDLQDPKKLEELQIIGKNGNVVLSFDTGMGITVKDLYEKYPDIYKMWVNTIKTHANAVDLVFGIFE